MLEQFIRIVKLMGNRFEVSVLHTDEDAANEHIDAAIAEIRRIEALLSTYLPDSQTNLINATAGIAPVKVEQEVIDLIDRSIRISNLTQGAFDITYGSIDKSLWNFDIKMTSLPPPEVARRMVRLIDYRNIEIDQKNRTVFLKTKGMRIGFGGIGKGYAADCAKVLLQLRGVKNGIINAAGDLITWGKQPNGEDWTVGIADPNQRQEAFSSLKISNFAVATSGDYEKFIEINGRRYSHTINPKTGLPVQGIKSVTILAPLAELADALATPVMVMGVEVGLDLINQLNGIGCIIITEDNQLYTSKNVRLQ